ncbi:MAG: AsmA family protein [Endomicrobia bacterium]|nr:AsmA family protein [Endomicrobiia bacterium]
MKKIMKFAGILLCIVFVAAIVAFVVLKSIFTEEKIRGYIDDAAKTYLGREVKYEKLSFAFVGVNLENFSISENASFDKGTFAEIKRFSVKVEIFPLLRKEIRVKRIIVNGLEIKIVKEENSKYNFDDIIQRFETPPPKETANDKAVKVSKTSQTSQEIKLPNIILNKLIIKNSNIFYADLPAKFVFSINDIKAVMEGFNFSKAFICTLSLNLGYKDENTDVKIPVEAVMTANLKNMDMPQADFNITSLKISFEDTKIEGKAFVKNLSDPAVTAEAVLFSLSNNTLKQFKSELPNFTVNKAEFDAKLTMSDFRNAVVNVSSFNAEMEDMKISGKASAVNFNDLQISAEVSLVSLSNNTLSYFVSGLPEFVVTKADIKANIGVNDLSKASVNIISAQAEMEDMRINAKASIKNLKAPEADIDASLTSVTNNALKHFAPDLPEFSISKADFNSKIILDLDKSAALLKNAQISVLGSDLKINGSVNWAKDLKYDLNAEVNFILDTLQLIVPKMVKAYEPKGRIKAVARITPEILKADINAENAGFKFEPVFAVEKINSNIKIDSLDNIKLTGLSGLFNDKKFGGKADYLKSKSSVNINMNFDMEALVLKVFPESADTESSAASGKKTEQTPSSAQPSAEVKKTGQASPSVLPLNLTADLKTGAIQIPYFHSNEGAVINIKMTDITDKLDKANGTIKFSMASGNVDDAEKLARAHKITKIMFSALAVVDKAGQALKIDALAGTNNKEGIRYDSFEGDLKFTNGKMSIQKMNFISKALSINITGTSDFKADKLDMKASIQPGPNKPIIMRITGTPSNPKGSLDIAGSVQSVFGKEIDALINKNKSNAEPGGNTSGQAQAESSTSAAPESEKNVNPAVTNILKSLDSLIKKGGKDAGK